MSYPLDAYPSALIILSFYPCHAMISVLIPADKIICVRGHGIAGNPSYGRNHLLSRVARHAFKWPVNTTVFDKRDDPDQHVRESQ